MTTIILDTCVIEGKQDLFFKNPTLRLIREIEGNEIYIPEIVIDEINSHLFDKIKSFENKVESSRKKLSEIVEKIKIYNIDSIKTPDIVYNKQLLDKQSQCFKSNYTSHLKRMHINIANCPSNVSVNDVLQHIFNRDFPFKEGSDKGIKDFLIWKTIVNIIADIRYKDVIFITNNKKDFLLENNELPINYKEDLNNILCSPECLKIMTLPEYINSITEIQPAEIYDTIIKQFIDRIPFEKYTQYGRAMCFDEFVFEDFKHMSVLGHSPCFNFDYDYELEKSFEIDEDSIKCIGINEEDIFFNFKVKSQIGVYILDQYADSCDCILSISATYNKDSDTITRQEISDVISFRENIDTYKIEQAEIAANMNIVSCDLEKY